MRRSASTRPALRISVLVAAAVALAGPVGCAGLGLTGDEPAPVAPALLADAHQLTFEGRRSGEGYFSRDGRMLIFQSEREPGNPFFQIFTLDLRSGETERLSPGYGKTTCGFLHPSGRQALFASTHLDPEAREKQAAEIAAREEGTERRYSWDYDPSFDLFSLPLGDGTAKPRRLTRARGYDAEAAWSPDGRHVVFASNRHAFAEGSGADPQRLADDPAHFIDLYVMDTDGRNVRRLTETPGYDGGPFFSPDGTRIVWRRFSQDGARAEIHTMRTDGTDVRRITDLGVMSWAPYYHPSGDYVIFATNEHGYDNFELYMVDAEGAGPPVRVTEAEGFDGLPVFSPDGQELIWTSNRSADGTSQLFRATWNDPHARGLLGLPDPNAAVVAPLLPLPERTDRAISEADLRAHVEALASPPTEGRLTGTPGERIATSYVARAFRSIGLEPAGDGGTYFQPFGFTAGISLGDGNALVVRGGGTEPERTFVVDTDWRPFAFSSEGDVDAAGVVFAGYGIVAPEGAGQRAVDSYAGLDVKDRWVLVFRYVPGGLSPESRRHLHRYSSLRHKAMVARDRGAIGILVASGPNSKVREELAPLAFDVSLAGTSIAAISITDAVAETLVAPSGQSLGALHDAADADSATRGFPLADVEVAATVALEQQRRTGRNVLGRLQIGPQPSADAVVVGAHVDHLGRGEGASSLARGEEKGMIHPGADDNASGVAALIEVAQHLSSMLEEGELGARRDVVFAAWSGEELGLLGSSHYVSQLSNPHAEDGELSNHVVAYLNFDMVGRLEDSVSLYGTASSPRWLREIERQNVSVRLPVTPQGDTFLPTDATVFYTRGVPILAAFTGAHSEYHTPRDTPDTLDYPGARDIAQLIAGITRSLAESEEGPEYVAVAATPGQGRGPGRIRVFLGTIPDYARSDTKGVMLSGLSPGGPAEKAGMRPGDVIVEVAGRQIENIYDYTYALDELQVGEDVTIVVMRGDRRLELVVTPASRD